VEDSGLAGFGNTYTILFLSPEQGRGFYWGTGPVIDFPTATGTELGVNKWGGGPSIAFPFKDGGPWVASRAIAVCAASRTSARPRGSVEAAMRFETSAVPAYRRHLLQNRRAVSVLAILQAT
jgi:hypothetical protein